MFVLHTGLQGNGKTLNTIAEVDAQAHKQGRVVYYHNIRDFDPDHKAIKAEWLSFDDPHKWYELPQNSIIVVDEAQGFYRPRAQGVSVPEYASKLETMRHSGHELHCITQQPSLIDTHFRKLCNSHIHYVRGHKGKVIKRWAFEKVNLDVEKRDSFPSGESSRILLNKDYFGCYKSVADGSEHHFKFNPPRALYVLLVCLVLISYFGYSFYQSRLSTPSLSEELLPSSDFDLSPPFPANSKSFVAQVSPDYISSRIPRIPDIPSSAPIYDDLTRPVTYPKLSCIAFSDSAAFQREIQRGRMKLGYRHDRYHVCGCNTQQGTRADVSFTACMDLVENGAFDHAKPDRPAQNSDGERAGGGADGTLTVAPPQQPREIVRVGGGNPGHLW